MSKSVTIIVTKDKPTTNALRFMQKVESEYAPKELDNIYVQKSALAEIGYAGEEQITVEIGVDIKGGIPFEEEEPKKTSVKFKEVQESEYSPIRFGTLYVPKVTLGKIGYTKGANLCVKISLVK